jgi:proline iminopeptidase
MRGPYPTIEPYRRGMLDAEALADIPGVLVNGRFDLQAPIANAWELHRVWPRAELVIVDDAGHAGDEAGMTQELIRATDRYGVRG